MRVLAAHAINAIAGSRGPRNRRLFMVAHVAITISRGTLAPLMLLFAFWLTSCKSKPFSQDAVAFVRPGETTRQEVAQNFGQPTYESADRLLVGYAQEAIRSTTTTRAIRWEGGLPKTVESTSSVGRRRYVLCFAFDRAELVRRFQIISIPPDVEIATAVAAWSLQDSTP